MPIAEAKKLGAMALFGEKYGEIVRVVAADDTSVELCGGTHVDNTSKISLFHIISEASVAAGVRRIEAVTGAGVLDVIYANTALMNETAQNLKAPNASDIAKRAAAVMNELKETKQALEKAESKLAGSKIDDIIAKAVAVGDVKVAVARLDGTDANELRKMTDTVKAENEDTVIVLGAVNGEKLTFCAACGKKAIANGAHAGNLVREIAKICGGNGGGKPDSAMAGGKDASQVDKALDSAKDIITAQIGG